MAALEEEVTQLKQALSEQRQGLETERQTLQAFMDAADAVTLKPTDQGFDALWHDLGVFAVELPIVTPTEKGSRVTLRIGNMTAGAVNNVRPKSSGERIRRRRRRDPSACLSLASCRKEDGRRPASTSTVCRPTASDSCACPRSPSDRSRFVSRLVDGIASPTVRLPSRRPWHRMATFALDFGPGGSAMRTTLMVVALAGVCLATRGELTLGATQQSGAPAAAAATADDPVRTLVSRLDLERYKATVKGLTQFGDRRQGTERNRKAVDWIEAQLKSYGCPTDRLKYEYNAPPPKEGGGGGGGRGAPDAAESSYRERGSAFRSGRLAIPRDHETNGREQRSERATRREAS